MNDNDNNDLFDIYGLEHEKVENNSQNNDNNIVPEVEENESIQPNNEVVENIEVKPIPDYIINEANNKNTNLEDELLKLYIGPNYESIVNGGYSYCTLFFGLYYLFYRKQYKLAYILIFIQVGVILANAFAIRNLWYLLSFLNLAIYFIMGASFKKNYVENAKEKITEINKQNISVDEKKEIVKKIGGVDNKAYILFISLTIIAYLSSMLTLNFSTPSTDLEFHFPEEFKQNTTSDTTQYKIDKYNYYELILNHRTSDNVCNYKVIVNNEYLNTDKEKTISKYLKDKYSLDNTILEEKKYEDINYFYYYDEKEKKDYYIHISDKYFSEISVKYVKDENKKCHEYTEYILTHTKKIK